MLDGIHRLLACSALLAAVGCSPAATGVRPDRSTRATVRHVRVAPCTACTKDELCVAAIGGEAPGPGGPSVQTSCQTLPAPCRAQPSCACLRAQPGFAGTCSVGAGGMLSVQVAMP